MANHVSFGITFNRMNDAAKEKLKELVGRMDNDAYDGEMWFGDMWVDGKDGSPTNDDVRQYSWTTENVGPKWCYIESADEDGMYGYSAWSWPEDGLSWLLEQLAEVDPNVVTTVTYEDEAPNFYGAYVYKGTEMYDGCEWEYEELLETFLHKNPEFKEHWDEENEEWMCDEDGDMTEGANEAEDAFRDEMYDIMHDQQDDVTIDNVKYILEELDKESVGC